MLRSLYQKLFQKIRTDLLLSDLEALQQRTAALERKSGEAEARFRSFYHRKGYELLSGSGLEIGAMANPAPVPAHCQVKYFDVLTREKMAAFFPGVDISNFVEPDFLGDIDHDGLSQFTDSSFDFVILSHVIEHVANPIELLAQISRITRPGGKLVLACPDKRFTFDKKRGLTPFEHLADEYLHGVREVTDEHYLDFLVNVSESDILGLPADELAKRLQWVRDRHEHVHVWDSSHFQDFLEKAFHLLQVRARCLHRVSGDETLFEDFSVWEMLSK